MLDDSGPLAPNGIMKLVEFINRCFAYALAFLVGKPLLVPPRRPPLIGIGC